MTALETLTNHHIKGTAVRNFQRFIEVNLGNEFFLELLRNTEFSKTTSVLASSWYPVHKYIEMHQMTAKAMGLTTRDFVLQFSRYHLEVDMNGIYRFFMRAGGVKRVLASGPRIDKAYSDYTKMETISNEDGIYTASVHVPEQYSDWYLWTLEGGITGVLNVCRSPMKSFKLINHESYEHNGEVIRKSTIEIRY